MNGIKGSLYGFVVGDALGVPVEFLKREDLKSKPVTDMIPSISKNTTLGYWSDDSAMTLCTMNSITQYNEINYKDMMDKFKLWVEEGYMTANDVCFGIGRRTLRALTFYNRELNNPNHSIDNPNWITQIGNLSLGSDEKHRSGNGSLMRILPVVLYLNNKNLSLTEKINIIRDVSSLTHSDEECISSCAYYMCFIDHLLETNNILESFNLASKDIHNNFNVNECGKLNRILNNDFINYNVDEVKSSGYVIDTLEASLWCLYNSNSYEETVLKAVNLGDDADTVGAITGSLAGLYYGYDNISSKWIDSLLKKNLLDNTINDFINTIELNKDKDTVKLRYTTKKTNESRSL